MTRSRVDVSRAAAARHRARSANWCGVVPVRRVKVRRKWYGLRPALFARQSSGRAVSGWRSMARTARVTRATADDGVDGPSASALFASATVRAAMRTASSSHDPLVVAPRRAAQARAASGADARSGGSLDARKRGAAPVIRSKNSGAYWKEMQRSPMGSHPRRVADHVDQPDHRAAGRADRTARGCGARADRPARRRHAHPMAVHRAHARFVPLARRSIE